MNDFTLLTVEQCFNEKLDVIKEKGRRAAVTDFAIALGSYVSDYRIADDDSLSGRAGFYWTKSDDDECDAWSISPGGIDVRLSVKLRRVGVRPVLPFPSSSAIPTNGRSVNVIDGIKEVEYGYYPKSAPDRKTQDSLNLQFKLNSEKLQKTGNSYTTDSVEANEDNTKFRPQKLEEYEYKEKRYVRVKIKEHTGFGERREIILSNGETYEDGEYVWIEVEPVKWLIDEKEKIMIAKDIIAAGVQFNHVRNYRTKNFDITDIKLFMDLYLEKDLFQQRSIGEQNLGDSAREGKYNPYGLDFRETTEAEIIESAIKGNVSIFLHGKPGCGKSDRVKQLDPDFIELNLSHLDPELLDGLAGEKDGKAVHIKPPWLEQLEEQCEEEPDKIHILFLEELTNASPMMQSKAYGIALDKKVSGRWELPEQARVVAAGNELEDSLVANEIAEPLYDRFAHVNVETSVEDWLEWAVTPEETYQKLDYEGQKDKDRPKIHPAIYAYIKYKGKEVLRTPYNREHPEPHADPRRWKMASDMLYATNRPWALQAIVGENLTMDFISFCQTPTLSVEDVIKGNYTAQDFENFDLGRQLALVTNMLSVDSENMPKVRKFIKEQLGEEMLRTFESQWTHGNENRLEQLQELKLEEQEERKERVKKGHSAKESNFTILDGIFGYEQIGKEYNKFLSRENKIGKENRNDYK